MARFYSLKKKDEDDAKTADPFGVLRPKVKNAEQQQVNIYDMAKAYVFLADGFEDIEALAPVDILRRGGLNVKTVSINATDMVASAHGVQVKADMMFRRCRLQRRRPAHAARRNARHAESRKIR